MASNSLLQSLMLILTLLSTTLVLYTFGAGHEELIDKLCNVTSVPVACTQCVKSGPPPAGPNWTNADVVQVILNCADDDFQELEVEVRKAIGDPDEKIRDAMLDCNIPIIAAINSSAIVAQEVAENKFLAAKEDIQALIFQNLGVCYSVINSTGIIPPPAVFSGLVFVESDFRMAFQILTSLTS